MAKSLNSISFTGYLGGDPRLHTFDDGTEVANLSVAIARQKKQDGEWVDDTIWVDVKAFGGQVAAIGQYLAKGSFVAVTGELAQPRTWEDKDGETRFTIVVDHARVTFGPRTGDGDEPREPRQEKPKAAAPAQSDFADDKDIPF